MRSSWTGRRSRWGIGMFLRNPRPCDLRSPTVGLANRTAVHAEGVRVEVETQPNQRHEACGKGPAPTPCGTITNADAGAM
jgi:hypothetical protein